MNFLGVNNTHGWPESAGVLILPAPFEQTSSYGTGSSGGPAAILEASQQVEFYDAHLGFSPIDSSNGIATLPFMETTGLDGAQLAVKLNDFVSEWLKKDKIVVTLGGEHTSVVGSIQAHSKHFDNLTVLQLDAHSDLRQTYQDSPWNHACAMARVRDLKTKIVQVGIRSECAEEAELVRRENIPIFHGEKIHELERNGKDWVADVIAATSGSVYITFDCDAFDPSILPATGTPEPGGLTWIQVDRLFGRLSRERKIVGFDINELAPIPDLHHPQFTAAKLVYRLIGYCTGI